MVKMPTLKLNVIKTLSIFILIDLIFCGSGRLIMIGGLSFRTLLFGLAMLYVIVYYLSHPIKIHDTYLLIVVIFVAYICLNASLVGDKPISEKFDFLSRYLYILLLLFYNIYFTKFSDLKSVEKLRRIFELFTFLFAIFSVALWLYAFRLGGAAYSIIEYGFFRPKVYGNFSILTGGIPRVFMKGSIFIPIGLLFQIDRLIDRPSFNGILKAIIYSIAIITTFTAGFFLATTICVVILLHRKRVLSRQIGIIFVVLFLTGFCAVSRFQIVNIVIERFSTTDYSSSFRLTQLSSIINEFVKKPLFGHGFAYEYTTIYGNSVRTTSGFEVAWGELLVDTGIIGFTLFVTIIVKTIRKLYRLTTNNNSLYVFLLGLVLICIESFTNPFINNSIGLTYFSICAGIVCALYQKELYYNNENYG